MGTPFFVIGRSKTPLVRSVSTLILPFFQIEICLLWSLFAVNQSHHNQRLSPVIQKRGARRKE